MVSGDLPGDSSVLNELKETIRKQAKEIESLRKELKGGTPAPQSVSHGGGGGGHGGGGATELSADDVALYLTRPFHQVAFQRVGWLSVFLVSLSFTALIMNGFEHTLERQIELAYFVPLLAGHGGNTGGQTIGTVLSALSAGTVTQADAPRIVMKESMAGLLMGSMLGVVVGPLAHYMMGISMHVATVILFTLPLLSFAAATLGACLPFLCLFLRLDPSVIAAPAMTSLVDVAGLLSYFLIAQEIFKIFGVQL